MGTRRTWTTIGMASPGDVRDLQTSVQAYHEKLLVALDNLKRAGTNLPSSGNFTQAAWDTMTTREEAFLAESVNELSPLAWLDAASAYARGKALVTELDAWRDQLAALKAPGVPTDPLPVPASKTSLFDDISLPILLVLGFLLVREVKK